MLWHLILGGFEGSARQRHRHHAGSSPALSRRLYCGTSEVSFHHHFYDFMKNTASFSLKRAEGASQNCMDLRVFSPLDIRPEIQCLFSITFSNYAC